MAPNCDHDDAKGLLIRNPNKPLKASFEGLVADDEISAQIEAIVFNDVNPALSAHGGFVTFAGHDKEGTAYFTMGGGCHGCSMSRQTMLGGSANDVGRAGAGDYASARYYGSFDWRESVLFVVSDEGLSCSFCSGRISIFEAPSAFGAGRRVRVC